MNQKNNTTCNKLRSIFILIAMVFITNIVKSTEAPGIAVPKEMEQFIKFKAIDSGMNYIRLKETVKKDQLPLLYQLLADGGYAPYWHNIARIIGFISDDPKSIPVLLAYFQRDDVSLIESIAGKVGSIAWIGKISGEKADSILKKAITKEGAEELAKLWINEGKWKNSDKIGKDRVIISTQSAAFQGLVFSGKKENWDLVEKLYNEQKEISLKSGKQTDIMSALVDAMVIKALITDNKNDVESYFRIDSQVKFQALRPYLDKYSLRNASRAR